jgi:hypothetical protein
MKRQIDFGEKNYVDCKTDKVGLHIRLYPGAWEDLMLNGTMDDLPDNATPIEYFRVNEKIKGLFYLIK